MEQKNDFNPLTTDEVLADAYASYNQDKIKIINNILSKINENNCEKAKTLIDDWNQFRSLHSDIYDLNEKELEWEKNKQRKVWNGADKIVTISNFSFRSLKDVFPEFICPGTEPLQARKANPGG